MLVVTICMFAGVGVMLGLVHFVGLRTNTRLYLEDGFSLRAIGLHLLRIVATGVAFSLIALSVGAVALLAGFVGFLLARITVQRRIAGRP